MKSSNLLILCSVPMESLHVCIELIFNIDAKDKVRKEWFPTMFVGLQTCCKEKSQFLNHTEKLQKMCCGPYHKTKHFEESPGEMNYTEIF